LSYELKSGFQKVPFKKMNVESLIRVISSSLLKKGLKFWFEDGNLGEQSLKKEFQVALVYR